MNHAGLNNSLLKDETKAYASLTTLMPDGSPQATIVWFNLDGEQVLINSAVGRVKDVNMRNDPRIALMIFEPGDPYNFLQIRGKVVEVTEEGAWEHINELSHKYRGAEYTKIPGQVRVKYRIQPEHFSTG